jgi:cholesterol oxidase
MMPWFAHGRLRLRRRFEIVGAWELNLDWDIARSRGVIDAIVSTREALSHATGGTPLVPPTWTLAKYLITPHPLGGCRMGVGPQDGVVDHRGGTGR